MSNIRSGTDVEQTTETRRRRQPLVAILIGTFALALGVAMLIWASVLNAESSDTRRDLQAIQTVVENLETKVGDTSDSGLAKAEVTIAAQQRDIRRLKEWKKHVAYCLPELRQELQSANIEFFFTGGWVTGGYIDHSSTVSRFCSDVFEDTSLTGLQGED